VERLSSADVMMSRIIDRLPAADAVRRSRLPEIVLGGMTGAILSRPATDVSSSGPHQLKIHQLTADLRSGHD
jgi:hypothetical protein